MCWCLGFGGLVGFSGLGTFGGLLTLVTKSHEPPSRH